MIIRAYTPAFMRKGCGAWIVILIILYYIVSAYSQWYNLHKIVNYRWKLGGSIKLSRCYLQTKPSEVIFWLEDRAIRSGFRVTATIGFRFTICVESVVFTFFSQLFHASQHIFIQIFPI